MKNWHSWKDGQIVSINPFESLPQSWKEYIQLIFDEGFFITLVGGGTRDYLLTNQLPSDLDFEVRHALILEGEAYLNLIEGLKVKLKVQFPEFNIEELAFGVFRVIKAGFSIEFAPPRVELYHLEQSAHGHSDFKIDIHSQLPYQVAWERRDFTFNAIGLEWTPHGVWVRDPLQGIKDLKKNELKACGEDFILDPVRFLRLARFKQQFNSSLSKQLMAKLSQFDLQKLTAHYFFQEAFKASDCIAFFKLCYKLLDDYQIPCPAFIKELVFLRQVTLLWPLSEFSNSSKEESFYLSLCLGDFQATQLQLKTLGKSLKLKQTKTQLGINLVREFNRIRLMEQGQELEIAQKISGMIKLPVKDLLVLIKMLDDPIWEALEQLQTQLIKLDSVYLNLLGQHKFYGTWVKMLAPPLRGREAFKDKLQLLGDLLPVHKRGRLSLYCHLQQGQ